MKKNTENTSKKENYKVKRLVVKNTNTSLRKKEIQAAVQKVMSEYGQTLKMLQGK